jgi:hypothetical protein
VSTLFRHPSLALAICNFQHEVRFTIVPHQITYVGDFNASVKWPKIGLITNRTLSLVDNRAGALQKLKTTYPVIAGSYPVRVEISSFTISE